MLRINILLVTLLVAVQAQVPEFFPDIPAAEPGTVTPEYLPGFVDFNIPGFVDIVPGSIPAEVDFGVELPTSDADLPDVEIVTPEPGIEEQPDLDVNLTAEGPIDSEEVYPGSIAPDTTFPDGVFAPTTRVTESAEAEDITNNPIETEEPYTKPVDFIPITSTEIPAVTLPEEPVYPDPETTPVSTYAPITNPTTYVYDTTLYTDEPAVTLPEEPVYPDPETTPASTDAPITNPTTYIYDTTLYTDGPAVTLPEEPVYPDPETTPTSTDAPITNPTTYIYDTTLYPEEPATTEPNSDKPLEITPVTTIQPSTSDMFTTNPLPTDTTKRPTTVRIPVPIDSFNTVDYDCSQGNTYYPVENDCDSYIECKNNVARKYVCMDGLHFNPYALYPDFACSFPSEVQCEANSVQRNPIPTNECPRQYGYFGMNDGDCSHFRVCQAGRATVMECPLGLVFNEELSSCDWPENVPQCNPYVFKDFVCPAEQSYAIYKYRYNNSCRSYVACHQGQPRLLSCDPGLAFDEESQTCVAEVYVRNCVDLVGV